MGMAFMIPGIVGGLIGTIFLECYSKGENYDPLIKVFTTIGAISVVIFAFILFSLNLGTSCTFSLKC